MPGRQLGVWHVISEFVMTTQQRQYTACNKLNSAGYRATPGDAPEGPTVIVEHPADDANGPAVIVWSVDPGAERY